MAYCESCGREAAEGVRFCARCGHPIGTPLPPSAPPPHQAATVSQGTDGLAVAALVLGVLGLTFLPLIGAALALILGIVALARIGKDPARGGKGLAIGGIVTGGVGILLLPVLVAIAIPTFLGARARAQDRATQASLYSALNAASVIFADGGNHDAASPEQLSLVEPLLTFTREPSTGPDEVSMVILPDRAIFASLSESGTCFALRAGPSRDTEYARGPNRPCSPPAFPDLDFGPSWD